MMKRFTSILLLFSATAVFSCGSSRNSDADQVTRALALTARTFINFFEDNLGNCEAFFVIYDGITEELESCDNGDEGSFQVTKLSVTCTDGPPLTATAQFTLEQTNCQDNGTGITSTGLMEITLDFSAAGNFGTLASTDLLSQGLTFVFTDFVAKVVLSSSNLSCSDSGDLTVDGDICSVASNCRRCVF
jgi:hypothetical protein